MVTEMDERGKLFKESLKKIHLPFRLSGLPLYTSENFSFKLQFIILCHFFFSLIGILGAIHYCYKGVLQGDDFIVVTYMAPCVCFSILGNVKAFTLILNRRNICEIIEDLVEIEERTKKYIVDEVYNKERKSLHKVILWFNGGYTALFIAFLLSPFSIMALKYYDEGKFELAYPFTLSYPFDPYRIELFPLVYLHQAEAAIVVMVFAGSADYFFYTCCLYISIQFKLLLQQFEKLVPDSRFRVVTFEDVRVKFIELVEWHQKLISLTNMVETVFAKSTLYNFISSSVLICLTLFDVMVIKDLAFALTYVFFLSMCLVQIFLLCYFGDKVTHASTELSGAVYNSLWYKGDSSVGKYLLLVLIRSQKPCKLTALGFADVNQRAFMRILSNAWSYFALLKTMYH